MAEKGMLHFLLQLIGQNSVTWPLSSCRLAGIISVQLGSDEHV